MTTFEFILAMLYIGLSIYCLELLYSNKDLHLFQSMVIILWGAFTLIGGIFLLMKSIAYYSLPIDGTFALFIGILVITWLIIKNKKK